jgi:hypothetical protein
MVSPHQVEEFASNKFTDSHVPSFERVASSDGIEPLMK